MRLAACLLLSACARPTPAAPAPPPPAWCNYNVRDNPTLGRHGNLGFSFFPAVSPRLETPLAAGGAHTQILALSTSSVAAVGSVTSSRPEVASFILSSVGGSPCQNQALLLVRTGVPGASELRLFDEGGGLLDEVGVTVERTATLAVDRDFSDAAPARILAGSLQGVHTTTLGADSILVGTGAVRFQLEGDLFAFPDRDAAPPWWGGDALAFTGRPGRGRVVADAGGAHVEVPVEVLDPASIGLVTLSATPATWPNPVEVTVGAGVYGAQCRWSWPFSAPEWVDGGWIGGDVSAHYRFTAPWPGTFTAECTLPGDQRQSIEITFQ
jgi:hypothetical protein